MENLVIKNIPINDRPIERLLNSGAYSLSNEELLAIILNSGTKNISVKNLSSLLLSKAGNVSNLKSLTYHDLISIKGIGKVKACRILALIEISKRMNRVIASFDGVKINDPKRVFDYYKSRIDQYQEHFYCIYLDARKKVIKEKMLFKGTANHSLVHPRDIFKEAYNLNSTFIICVHNHPSGDVLPSKDDFMVTKRISEVGKLMGVKLIDHVIISENNYYSFLENGQI